MAAAPKARVAVRSSRAQLRREESEAFNQRCRAMGQDKAFQERIRKYIKDDRALHTHVQTEVCGAPMPYSRCPSLP